MNLRLLFDTDKNTDKAFALHQNTPNPIDMSTKISFDLPKDGEATLTVYTAEGKTLRLINNHYKAGRNEVIINKLDLNASGILYYRLDTHAGSATQKMVVID